MNALSHDQAQSSWRGWLLHRWALCHKFVLLFCMGVASGLPLALTSGTLQAWYSDFPEIDLVAIGSLSLVGLPYALKWLWAPVMDRFIPPWLGRRRGWIFLMQGGLIIGLVVMANLNPGSHPLWLAGVALCVAWCSASQDIAIDAYRTDLLQPDERGIGIGVSLYGYRLAMLISGGLAIMLASFISWHMTYWLMALVVLLTMVATWFAPEPALDFHRPASLRKAIVGPVRAFFRKRMAWALLLLMVLYKLTDAFGLALNTTFLLRGVGFSKIEVGSIYKVVAIAASLIGTVAAAYIMKYWRLYRCLLVFGICQALANLAFAWLAAVGHNIPVMIFAVWVEYFFSSLGTVAFVAFLMALCHRRYTATQFALFTAVSALGRVVIGPLAGGVAFSFGWVNFYLLAVVMAMPGLGLLWYLRGNVLWKKA
jgi:MFS transporter, PAT family, beta-lactamase induction signal transducer AmpG